MLSAVNQEARMFFIVLLFLINIFHLSLSAIDQPTNLLQTAVPVQFSPSNTSCCTGTTECVNVPTSPWCAFDGNSSTRWILTPGQSSASLTLNLSTPSLIDHFELILDPSSIIPSSVTVTAISQNGNLVTSWVTYFNKTCQSNDALIRNVNSVYSSCIQSGQAWNISVPDGLFSVRNGSNGWFWWRPFQLLQLTIEMKDSDYSNPNDSFALEDIRLFGWSQPTQTCNCHPVGVADIKSPCSSDGTCNCRGGGKNDSSQCIPYVTLVDPTYGPVSGGTTVSIFGNYLQNATEVAVGNTYIASVINSSDTTIQIKTTGCSTQDLNNPLPIRICWEQPTNGSNSCIILSNLFTYKPDPVIQSIYPRLSIDYGGIPQTVIGQNLDSVAYPYLIIFSVKANAVSDEYNYTTRPYPKDRPNDKFCQRVNSTMLKCLSMPLFGVSSLGSSDYQLYIGISVDINKYNTYNQKCNIVYGQCNFQLIVAQWLQLPTPPNNPVGYPSYKGRMQLTILGQYFLEGAATSDYQVTVGGIACDISGIVENSIEYYPPDASSFDTTKPQETILSIGAYYPYTINYLQYYPTWISDPTNRNGLIGGLVGGIGGLCLIVLLVFVVLRCRRKREKDEEELDTEEYDNRYTQNPYGGNRDVPLIQFLPKELQESAKRYTVEPDRIERVRQVGKGQFGIVFEGTFEDKSKTKHPVAIKTVADNSEVKDKVECLEEAMRMADFCHKHVLSLLAIAIDNNSPLVVLPFMENGDLKKFISNAPLTTGDLVNFSLQVAMGMEYLASTKFVHRDLAARNCMVNKDLLVKVADFGLARDIFENDYYRRQDVDRPLPFKWMSIECLTANGCFTKESDVWAYGILLWELMTRGEQPYSGIHGFDLKAFLLAGRRLEQPPDCPDFMYDIMSRCWLEDPEARPTFKDIVRKLKETIIPDANKTPEPTDQDSTNAHQDQNVIAQARHSYQTVMNLSQDQPE